MPLIVNTKDKKSIEFTKQLQDIVKAFILPLRPQESCIIPITDHYLMFFVNRGSLQTAHAALSGWFLFFQLLVNRLPDDVGDNDSPHYKQINHDTGAPPSYLFIWNASISAFLHLVTGENASCSCADSDSFREHEDKGSPTGGVLVARRELCGPAVDKVTLSEAESAFFPMSIISA